MKKLLFLFSIFILAACGTKTSCVLAQFPPQLLNANASCQASLPNYVPKAVLTGGCTGTVVTQTPAPGTLLTSANRIINVVLKATSNNGKSSQRTFTVTLTDTITPRITGITAEQMEDTLLKKSNYL